MNLPETFSRGQVGGLVRMALLVGFVVGLLVGVLGTWLAMSF